MLLCVGGLAAVQALKGAKAADRLAAQVQPGVVFLGRWLLSFLTVVIVPLPDAVGELWAQGGLGTMLKVLAVHLLGWCATHSSTAATACATSSSSALLIAYDRLDFKNVRRKTSSGKRECIGGSVPMNSRPKEEHGMECKVRDAVRRSLP